MSKIHQKFSTRRDPATKVGRKWMTNAKAPMKINTRMGNPRRKVMPESIAQDIEKV
jgi:hypothetical protein